MPTVALGQIDVGGPCKISDNGVVIYFDDGVTIKPEPVWRAIPSAVGGEHDDVLVDLTYKIIGTPKSVWNASYRGALLPSAYTNWSAAGARMCGTANRAVNVLGTDSKGFNFTRACLTKMPDVFLGLGQALYGQVEYTGYIGQGKALVDVDAFYSENSTAWDGSDYPTSHQETMCTLAWGAVTGWDTVFAEGGFKLTHELKTNPVKQGNVTVDQRIQSYRAMLSFTPEEPTTTQLLTALAFQGASSGLGVRRSANAAAAVVAGSGISVTVASAGVRTGQFEFDSKKNRHGEFAMVSALTAPGTRLTLA